MVNRKFRFAAAAAFGVPLALLGSGCAMCKTRGTEVAFRPARADIKHERKVVTTANLLPPDAKPGDCFVRVYVPPQFENREEKICVREASERLEVIPAQYDWVEEQVVVKEASTIIEEIPAQFETQERQVLVDPGYTGWQVQKTAKCADRIPPRADDDMLCLVSHEPVYETVTTEVMVKPATCREVTIPAEYQTVRRQKLVAPATTRRIPIPAEFATVNKVQKVADARFEWRRVDCRPEQSAEFGEFKMDGEMRRVGYPEDAPIIHHDRPDRFDDNRRLDPIDRPLNDLDDRRFDDLNDEPLDDLDDEPLNDDGRFNDPPVNRVPDQD